MSERGNQRAVKTLFPADDWQRLQAHAARVGRRADELFSRCVEPLLILLGECEARDELTNDED
jgi:hypothetical protein